MSFVLEDDGAFKHIFTNEYSLDISSYSIPLLRGIAEKLELKADDCFIFTHGTVLMAVDKKGTTATKNIILFSVKDSYYDISDDPKKKILEAIIPSPL